MMRTSASFYHELSNSDILRVHQASMALLDEVGFLILHRKALEQLEAAGAIVDFDEKRVRFSNQMIKDALLNLPKRFLCAGIDSTYDLTMDADRKYCAVRSAAGSIAYYSPTLNQLRPLKRQDCINYARLVDALPNIDILGALTPQDVPPETYDIHTLKDMLENNRKHIFALTKDSRNLEFQMEMMTVVAGSREELARRPICSGIACITDPLAIHEDEIERLLLYGKYHIPVFIPLTPIMGATAPYTVAGALTQTNAEFLASIVLIHFLCPGLPTWYYVLPTAMDMRSSAFIMGSSPETILLATGAIQMARYYNVPSTITTGSSSCCQTHQLMFHLGTSSFLTFAAGASMITGAGGLESVKFCSPEVLIIFDEVIAQFRTILGGYEINDHTIGLASMQRVQAKGNYLEDAQTLSFLREYPHFKPSMFQWYERENENVKMKTIFGRAENRLEYILKNHEVPELSSNVRRELSKIVKAADRQLV